MTYQAVATCSFGLESVVAGQLRHLGAADVAARDGRVFFKADAMTIATANIRLSVAERVLIVLSVFPADTFDTLFDAVKTIEWNDLIGRKDAFPVKGFTMNSTLHSVPACQKIIKKAVVTQLQQRYGGMLTEDGGVEKRIQFSLIKDECTIMLDTSGDGLHKRGYRPLLNLAPIRETLAAGIADFARIGPGSEVRDPFCGSGTLVIEAALRASGRAVGINRSFSGENYSFLGSEVFRRARESARESERTGIDFQGLGSDIDRRAVELSRENAKRAGVGHLVRFEVLDARKLTVEAREILLANPPYGQRMEDEQAAQDLLEEFGRCLNAQKYRGLYIISNHPRFEQVFGKKAHKRRKLYNGMLPCQLYMYY